MIKKLLITVIVVALLFAAFLGVALHIAATKLKSTSAVEVEIVQGSSLRKIASDLAANGVIKAPRLFEIMARTKRLAGKLRAGSYEFPAGTTLVAALDKLARGDVKQYALTVVEGWTIKDIAAALKDQPYLASASVPDKFVQLAMSKEFTEQMGITGSPTLEGYLFPDTYFVTKGLTADVLIKRLVDKFKDVWASLNPESIAVTGLDEAKLVTLASIVEKETGAAAERPLVASVFYNRLRTGMPLQSDPTIIYGLPNYDGNIRKGDITNPHPYNTYVHAGLPPGPICNPGKASLDAVIAPAKSEFFYFVSRNDGTHVFSKSIAEHSAAVREYQLKH